MAKRAQKTRVYFDGVDISSLVLEATLHRMADEIERVVLTVVVSELEVELDGTLNIYIATEE